MTNRRENLSSKEMLREKNEKVCVVKRDFGSDIVNSNKRHGGGGDCEYKNITVS